MKGSTVAILGIGVVVVGGGLYLWSKKNTAYALTPAINPRMDAQMLGALRTTVGAKPVSTSGGSSMGVLESAAAQAANSILPGSGSIAVKGVQKVASAALGGIKKLKFW